MDEIGLFPLRIVLLPRELIPLHIFEERYKELINGCLADDSEFGLVYADENGVSEVGTRAQVTQVVTRFPDGRLNILVRGGERFRLDEVTTGQSFHTGLVSTLEDADDPAGQEAVDRALRSFEQLREVTRSDVEVPDQGVAQLSYELAGRVDLPMAEKLELLSEVSERRRMDRLAEFLESALSRAERARLAAERASTNGRVELG